MRSDLVIPWPTPELWHAVNDSMATMLRTHRSALHQARSAAFRIINIISMLNGNMQQLCVRTCPICEDICCRRAKVWYDFKDLLYLHLSESRLPPAQALSAPDQRCRYITPQGCMLPRTERPFICTWYLCPRQQNILRRQAPKLRTCIEGGIANIKRDRRLLESVLIQSVADRLGRANRAIAENVKCPMTNEGILSLYTRF